MSNLGNYLNTLYPTKANIHTPLSNVHVQKLERIGIDEAVGTFYSGLISVADAIRGLENEFYSWGVVKLYYSVFYFSKSFLEMNGDFIFYIDESPYHIKNIVGQYPQKGKGTTHKFVLDLIKSSNLISTINSQQIDFLHPLDWLINQRERINYKVNKFPEPDVITEFSMIKKTGLRKAISAYLNDKLDLYTFDKDHSIMALPIYFIRNIANSKVANFSLSDDDIKALEKYFKDEKGILSDFLNTIRTFA